MKIHPLSDVASTDIGLGTTIWQFSVVLKGAQIGQDCNICAHTFIENDVVLGNRVTVKSGVYLWDGIRAGNDVFIGPCVAFTNDKYPRSKQYPDDFPKIQIGSGASIGANATILPGVQIGEKAMIGAGSVVTKDVPPKAVVAGNPARIIRYIEV
ncbi:acyltransferase [Vibrio pomeroyi]|uniref:acyltransferase n=1 Tax=Vibrio pomeroyi TaxID=198832 RepID=UPI0021C460DD|nr:acyltransferase [Vibrio pomeroyi]